MIYLYIKQHSVTKLKYFGMTRRNPFTYNGSGKYWISHIKKHGKEHVQTLEVWGFDKNELCTNFALKFSKDNDIVESKEWANLCEEDGVQGGLFGFKHSDETKIKMSNSGKNKSNDTLLKMSNYQSSRTKDHIDKLVLSNTGKKRSKESKDKMSKAHTGRKWSDKQRLARMNNKKEVWNKGKTGVQTAWNKGMTLRNT